MFVLFHLQTLFSFFPSWSKISLPQTNIGSVKEKPNKHRESKSMTKKWYFVTTLPISTFKLGRCNSPNVVHHDWQKLCMHKEYLSGMRRALFSSTLILMVLAMAIWSITLLFITPLNYCQMDCSMVWCVASLIGCVVCSIVWLCSFFNKPTPWKHEIGCDEGVVQQKDLVKD